MMVYENGFRFERMTATASRSSWHVSGPRYAGTVVRAVFAGRKRWVAYRPGSISRLAVADTRKGLVRKLAR